MSKEELTIRDRLEDILESIELIQEWSKGMTELKDFMTSPNRVMAFNAILEIAEMISADASELLSAVIDANPKFHKLYQKYILVA